MTTTDNKSVKLEGEFGSLFKAMRLVWKGELCAPKGMTIRAHTRKLLVITIDRNHFSLESKKLAILDTRPLDLYKSCAVPNRQIKGLELRIEEGRCAVYVVFSHVKHINLDPTRRAPIQSALKPGIHHPSALLITEDVKPRQVQGGAPSLGKRK